MSYSNNRTQFAKLKIWTGQFFKEIFGLLLRLALIGCAIGAVLYFVRSVIYLVLGLD
jgi:hypothetical protein